MQCGSLDGWKPGTGEAWLTNVLDFQNTVVLTDLTQMFQNCVVLTGIPGIGNLKHTSTELTEMFNGATEFNGDLNSFDVSKVTSMHSLFKGASTFDQPLNNWKTGRVTLHFCTCCSFFFHFSLCHRGPYHATRDNSNLI